MSSEYVGALTGMRVVEWGEGIAAPYCGKLLADLGAEVVKVEPPDGDLARRHGPFPGDRPHPERSGLFLWLNTNKLSVTLDILDSSWRQGFDVLLAAADVLVMDRRPSTLRALDLPIESIHAINPRLVVTSVTGFGLTGPYRDYRATALTCAAAGGASITIGEPGRPPLTLPLEQPEYAGGVAAGIGTLAALLERERSGRGQVVDIAIADVVAFYGGITSPLYTGSGLPWARAGHRASGSGGYYPYTILPCRDGHVCLITRSGGPWKTFVEIMGNPAWATEPRYRDRKRMGREYPDEVDALLLPWLKERSSEEFLDLCRSHGLPFSVVRRLDQVARCPHLAARDFFVNVERDDLGTFQFPGAPYRFSKTPWAIRKPAPRLGEDNHLIADCGLQIADWKGPEKTPKDGEGEATAGEGALAGVRVVDFGWVAVGPVLSSILADLGAEVIKVESRRRLDYCRLIPRPVMEGESVSGAYASRADEVDRVPLFHQYNRGKLGITVDLGHPEAPGLLKRLVARADVVVENFTPGVMRRHGLDYESLRAVRPDLIMISCSAAGQSGPWADLKTFAPTLSSLAGLEGLIGYPGERVLGEMTFGYADPSNAHHGAFAVLAALRHRTRTGEGQYIDMAQLEATVGLVGEGLLDFFMNGRVLGPHGTAHPRMAPHGNFPCLGEDIWLSLAVASDAEWCALAQFIGEAWAADARFAEGAGRVAHRGALEQQLAEWTRGRDAWDLTRALQAQGVAAFPVLRLEEQEKDPHFQQRGLLAEVHHPRLGTMRVYNSPLKLSRTPARVRRTAPLLSEHTLQVLRDIGGLTEEEIRALEEQGVLT